MSVIQRALQYNIVGSDEIVTPTAGEVAIGMDTAGVPVWVDSAGDAHSFAGDSTVESVTAETANAINNTDPANPIILNATAAVAGTMSAANFSKLGNILRPAKGANLADANATVNPGRLVSEYWLPAATLTTGRTLTLGTATNGGGPQTTQLVQVIRFDITANTFAVANGGAGGGTLYTFPNDMTIPVCARFFFDSTNWILVGVFPVTAS